jgi:hypothetical protein
MNSVGKTPRPISLPISPIFPEFFPISFFPDNSIFDRFTRYTASVGTGFSCSYFHPYALSIENAGGNNDTKCLYFPFCLDQALLTWLESLEKYSIDKWGQLKEQLM